MPRIKDIGNYGNHDPKNRTPRITANKIFLTQVDGELTVLVLHIENEQLGYTIAPVAEPYEREVHAEDVDYGFDDAGSTIFFAEGDGKLAGRIRMLKWWNQFGYVEDLVVNPE